MTSTLSARLQKELPPFSHWRVEFSPDRIAWLGIDKQSASTNVLSREVLTELEQIIAHLTANPPSGLIIYSRKQTGFISGADINEFPEILAEDDIHALILRGHQLLNSISKLPCTTVAMIDGYALGGGLELAMACDARVAVDEDNRTLGLPEVQLGLHPGFGGTVRAVQLAGVLNALPMMLSGTPMTPRKARKIGLIDRVVERSRLTETAAKMTRRPPRKRKPALLDRLLQIGLLRPLLAKRMRAGVATRAQQSHYPAPYAIIDLWEQYAAQKQPAYDAEAQSFADLITTPTSQNLVRVYFLQERLKQSAASNEPEQAVQHLHVVGAGIMGGDIAAWAALQGLTVTLQDREMKYIEPALERAGKLFHKRLSDPGNRAAAQQRLQADVDGVGISRADIVLEAIFEDGDAKRALFKTIEPQLKPGAIIGTNTSSIPLEELATCLAAPEQLIGLHFFNPVAKLPLVEVVAAESSSPSALAIGMAFTRQIGKLPLPCRSYPGFLVNRILAPYMAEALELVAEGQSLAEIDRAAVNFGMPMGPIELIDSVGIDVAQHVAEILAPVVGRPVSPELKKRLDAGRLGRKSGHGFYRYDKGKPVKPSSEPSVPEDQLQERLMLAFVNEAAQCLADDVVKDPELVDAGVIFGTGFAPFRGGPLNYAAQRGVQDVLTSLESLTARHGDRFRPSPAWQRLAE